MADDESQPASANVKPKPALNGKMTTDAKSVEADKGPLSVSDVLKSPTLNDDAKFDVFKGLVEGGRLTNKEVVNAILHLVRSQSNRCTAKSTSLDFSRKEPLTCSNISVTLYFLIDTPISLFT